MVKWLVVGALSFLLVVVALVILGSPEPPASLDEANAEQLEMIETALAAQDEAGRLAEESATALAAQEEAWAKVEAGPQFVLREVAKSADRLDSLGRHTQAQQMRDEAWASFDANPVVQEAKAATEHWRDVSSHYTDADRAATEALEAVRDSGLWDLYEKASDERRGG